MSFQGFSFNLPSAQMALVNPQTGQPTNNFQQYLLSLFNRTGAGTGIVPVVKTGLIAAGASQTTALLLSADWNEVDTVASGTGVQIPPLKVGNDIWVWNNGAHTLNIFPPGGSQFHGQAINAAVTLAAGNLAYFQCWQPTLLLQILTATP